MIGGRRLVTLGSVLVAGVLALVAAPPATAQTGSTDRAGVLAVDASGAPQVEVVVRAGPAAGATTYVAAVDGIDRPVTARPVDGRDLTVGIVVDNPASLPAEELRALRTAALELVLAAPPGTAVAVAGTAGPEASLATDVAGAVAAVAALAGPDRTTGDPLAAVTSTIRATAGRAAVPPTLVLLASSGGTGTSSDGPEVASRLQSRPATIEVLSLGAAPTWLSEVAASTGGGTVVADGEALRLAARQVGADLAALRVVEFELPPGSELPATVELVAPASAGGPVRLVVPQAEGSGGPGLGVAAVLSGAVVLAVAAAGALVARRRRTGPATPGGGAVAGGSDPIVAAVTAPTSRVPAVRRSPTERPSPAARPAPPQPAGAWTGRATPREARLLSTLADPDPAVRRRGAQLAGHGPPSATIRARLVELLGDEPPVAEMAAYSLGEQGYAGSDAVQRLSHVARHHPERRCREAAVAALGAYGAGLPAILAASTDDCAAVRRRAVVALAPFDGPEVDAALRRAAADGDLDVRQAARDLSGR